MKQEQLQRANYLVGEIMSLESDFDTLSLACSPTFNERTATINILGTSQNNGYARIPRKSFKKICAILLIECKTELNKAKKELENL